MEFLRKGLCLLLFFAVGCLSVSIKEVHVKTSSCDQCGMTALGELSAKVCGKSTPYCCVAPNLDNVDDNFQEGGVDIFSGVELRECYNFEVGDIASPKDISITLYHALTDGGKFDWANVLLSDGAVYRCFFNEFLDGYDYEVGKDCIEYQ